MLNISAQPTSCSQNCLCHYDIRNRVNIMNCSAGDRSRFPTVEPKTDWLVVANGNLSNLCYGVGLDNIKSLVLKGNNITSMCDKFGENLNKIGLNHIDLSENALTRIPKSFEGLKHVHTLLLLKNQYICDCTMLWMVDWLVNFTTASGNKIVSDYVNVVLPQWTNGRDTYLSPRFWQNGLLFRQNGLMESCCYSSSRNIAGGGRYSGNSYYQTI